MTAPLHLTTAMAAEHDAYVALMAGRPAGPLLIRARDAYLTSNQQSGQQSWGRLIGAVKMAILAGDGVEEVARRAVADAAQADSPASAYARALSQVALGGRPDVSLMLEAGEPFQRTGRALAALADGDGEAYRSALAEIVADFEGRQRHLSGIAIADTALVLERLAELRGVAAHPASALLPPPG